ARKHVDELHTFSVGVQGSPDLQSARAAARHLRTIHHEYILTPEEVFAELPNIVYYLESFDQDLVRSAIPTYLISRLASQEVKVVLTGEGADELFAGYRYHREDFRDPASLHRELWRSVSNLHNINLQRVDRMTMAHSLEGRVPFLDLDTIELAQTIPPELKLHSRQGRVIEKWILRKACEDLLPVENVWREKEQFDEGSGTIDLVAEKLENWMTPAEFERYARAYSEAGLCSLEEGVYHKWLCERYPDPSLVLDNVARWSERPEVKPLEDAVSMSDVEKLDADPLSKSLRTTND
ncbi:MAG: asparagine synthase-related protein, partial [Acidobacteriota bacterium]